MQSVLPTRGTPSFLLSRSVAQSSLTALSVSSWNRTSVSTRAHVAGVGCAPRATWDTADSTQGGKSPGQGR